MRDFISTFSNGDISKAKTVASLIFRLESGQMKNRLNWPTGHKIRQSNERLGWGSPDAAVPPLPIAGLIVIAADHDDAGLKAAEEAAARFEAEGRAVSITTPPTKGSDFNDTLRGQDRG